MRHVSIYSSIVGYYCLISRPKDGSHDVDSGNPFSLKWEQRDTMLALVSDERKTTDFVLIHQSDIIALVRIIRHPTLVYPRSSR